MKHYYLAVDLGAGEGTKIGFFVPSHGDSSNLISTPRMLRETALATRDYGPDFSSYLDNLEQAIRAAMDIDLPAENLRGIGIATAGILRSDGSFQLIQNLKHFNNCNLRLGLEQAFRRPAAIENDANAGALAEWSILQTELLYWVFGGGWGGAWVTRDGSIQHSARDWDGDDSSLHYSNEPGYAIPLDKITLRGLFREVGGSYERFEQVLSEELGPESLNGPNSDPKSLRAETLLSGPGRCRIFRALVGDDDFYERFLDIHETRQMSDPAIAGKHISKLSSMRVEAALNTDRLYGKILAHGARILIKQAETGGLPEGSPICLGGKPSYALPYFGPSTQRILGRFGLMNYLRPSVIDERGLNANLVGAGVLAMKSIQENGE